MSDWFDTDAVTKGYDSRIMGRIFGYLRHYKLAVAVTALALVVGTAGELFLPVLIRRIVDESLMSSWYAVDRRAGLLSEGAPLGLRPAEGGKAGDPILGGRVYIRAARLSALTGTERRSLEDSGLLDRAPRYLFRVDPADKAQAAAVTANAASMTVADGLGSMSVTDLRKLSVLDARAIRKGDAAVLAANAALLLAALAVVLATAFIQTLVANLLGQRIMKDLRMELFRHTATRSLSFLSRQPVGRLVTRLTSDVETINQFFTDVVVAFIKDFSIMIGVVAVLLGLDLRLGAAVVASLPPVLLVSAVARKRARDAFRRQRQWTSKVNSYIAEQIAGITVVKLLVREEDSKREFEGHDAELMRANLGEMYVYATFRPIVDFLSSLSTAIIIYVGAYLVGSHLLSLGTLIAFVNLIRMFYSPVMDISEKYTLLQSAMAGGERVFALLDANDAIPDEAPAGRTPVIAGRIEFDHVWFAYKGEDWVIKDLSFVVEPGETVAIVGYTGAGKTTIASLITRLWDVQKGEIRLDGRPIRSYSLSELRRSILPVLQEVFLFSGSIEDNIRLGTDVSEERMRLASRAVHAEDFITRLGSGYATQLAEGATNISQGQRQLLSFARVLAHSPAVVILDEATSSIDTETETMIQSGLEALLAGRTSLVIAHRLSTIKHADRIIALAGGRMAEQGSHDELLERRGLYWNLYRLQYGGKMEDID